MKVLILTNPTYEEFVWNTVRPYHKLDDDNLILVHGLEEKIDDWDELHGIGYDIGISFMYQYKVPAKEVNTHTWINFHPAPLPEYKGRNLCYHAIMNGEEKFGATIHYMDENFDTGDIIDVFRFYITEDDTAESLSNFTIDICKSMFHSYFPEILAGKKFERIPNLGGTYYKKEKINDNVNYHNYRQERQIRAVYFPPHYPKIRIGNVDYKVVRDE